MKLPICWLKDYVNIGSAAPEDISAALLNVGFEVEEIIYAGEGIDRVVSGKVLECVPHENSNHLHKCRVNVGKETLEIICGAPNVKAGDVVPCALVGASLPGGITIKAGEIRGAKSNGMLCSGKELGIDNSVIDGAEVDGLLQLPANTPLGKDIKSILGLDEYVLDVSVTANRPDCQSIVGLAREVAASMKLKFKAPKPKYAKYPFDKSIYMPKVNIQATDACSRYTGRLITGVKIGQSPKWLRDRLRLCGLRPINNIVDITNYVLLEIGQPLHAFDIRFIDTDIVVRKAADGEKIVALDGEKYTLNKDMLVIADNSKGLAIAGVMGGQYSGVQTDTDCVFLEAARFERRNIRITSRKLGLRSDSSSRYEKGVDYVSVDAGRERALTLIDMLGAGKVVDIVSDDGISRPEPKIIETTAKQISDLIGISIKQPEIVKILKLLEFGVTVRGKKILCSVPLFREDVEDYSDLSEEVIRYFGYDNLKSTYLKKAKCTVGGVPDDMSRIDKVKELLCGAGAYEMMSYSFINENAHDFMCLDKNDIRRNVLKLHNPLNEDLAVMRTQLVHNMLAALAFNQSRGNETVRLFEPGRIYIPTKKNELPLEKYHLSIGLYGEQVDFYAIKGMVCAVLDFFGVCSEMSYSKQNYMHPGISADVTADGKYLGYYGEVHPTVAANYNIAGKCYIAEIDLSKLLCGDVEAKKYAEISKFPAVKRDLAVTVKNDYMVGDMLNAIKSTAGEILEEASLFDIYRGNQIEQGYKSVAFSLKFRDTERTLGDNDIQPIMERIFDKLKKEYGAKLRQ